MADSERWRAAQAEHAAATARYRAACSARDELVAELRAAGATWGELARLTGLDRAQLLRMVRRQRERENGSQ